MELSWTTFILEIINFLVLVWVLKRLFYAPVKRAIAERRAAVEKTLQDAESSKREAHDLQSRYEGRLREWEVEKEHQKEEFRKELSEERTKQLKLTENLVAEEREKAEAQQEKKDAERRMSEEREAMKQALEFTSRVLKDVACPELEGKIVDLVTKQLCSTERESLPSPAAQSWDRGASSESAICLFPDGAATRHADYGSQEQARYGSANRVCDRPQPAGRSGNYGRVLCVARKSSR